MRLLGNLFLILFLTDGVLSLLGELVATVYSGPIISALQHPFGFALLLLSLILYIGLGIDRRLPKRIFLPQIVFVFVCFVAMLGFSGLFEQTVPRVLVAALQLLLGVLPLLYLRKATGKSLLMTRQMLSPPVFSFGNTLSFFAVNVLLLPLLLVVLGFSTASYFITEQSGGFMRLSPYGLYMGERVYGLENKTIRLVSMVHVGEQGYYEGLVESIFPGRTIVLAEGVTDKDNLLQHKFSYGNLAELFGLASQEKMRFKGKEIDPDQIGGNGGEGDQNGTLHIARADIDIGEFQSQTIEFLDALGQHLMNSPSAGEGLKAFNAWVQEHMTPAMNQAIMDDILFKRNREVIGHMEKARQRYDTIVIPWGALHMPGIEEAVLEEGFLLQKSYERLSIDFRKFPFARLFQEFSGKRQAGEQNI